jgi:hypothetical protein
MNSRTFGAGVALSLLPALFSTADAAYVVTFEQVGSDVVVTGGGSINLNELLGVEGGTERAGINPSLGEITGPASLTAVDEYVYPPGFGGPPSFGPGLGAFSADSGSGGIVGIGKVGLSTFDLIIVPDLYVSGNPLSDTSTYLDKTFASLGVTPGTYVYSWGTGADVDTFTVQIGVPEPSTWAMLLIGVGGLGYSAYRRRAGVVVKAV